MIAGDDDSESEMSMMTAEDKEPSLISSIIQWLQARSPATLHSLSRTVSGLYCLLVISIYITVTVNKLVSSPMHAPEVEVKMFNLKLKL